jgi:23S rRNA U2552 (ribose-2'-O)-methylase RlmE/FtsJ
MYRYSFNSVEYKLPEINIKTCNINSVSILNGFHGKLLMENKNKIDKYYDSNLWDKTKKIINPYELVYITNKKTRFRSVSTFEPLSRSFFKMIEMSNEFLKPSLFSSIKKLKTLHLAEGPGGFMEGIRFMRNYNKDDVLYGMTLISGNKEIPSWKKTATFLKSNPQIKLVYGIDNSGDLYNIDNIYYLEKRIGGNCIPIITGDGGFDFSVSYNLQELYASKLLFGQILAALKCQEIGGTFILKFFDMNNLLTLDFLFILQCCYSEIIIYKPFTSRVANSERYIVCKYFKGIDKNYLDRLLSILCLWNNLNDNIIINRLFDNLPANYYNYMFKVNSGIIKQQVDYINKTINIINNKYDSNWYKDNEIEQLNNAYNWCKDNNVPYK